MLTPLFISEPATRFYSFVSVVETPCHDIAIGTGDHACSALGCIVQRIHSEYLLRLPVDIHVQCIRILIATPSTETMAFTIIISGSAIFSAGLRPFFTRHCLLLVDIIYYNYTLKLDL